jgi:protein TonB
MFEGFDRNTKRKDGRRFGVSLAVSGAVYLGLGSSIVIASAAVVKHHEEEKLVQVEFVEPPAPEPEPPPPPPPEAPKPIQSTKPARAKVVRPELEAPDEIPDEKPQESDAELSDAPPADQGQEGFLTGQVGGTGTGEYAPPPPPPPPPPPKIVKTSSPVRGADNVLPEYPRSARRAGITGTVLARIYVTPFGKISKVEILEGPEVFHEAVRAALMTWKYEPARLSNGQAVADTHVVRIPFTLQN